MPTHSSILAWKNPWIEKSGGLQFMGSQSETQLSIWAHNGKVCVCVFVCVCNWITLLYTWNIVNQLHLNEKRNIIFQYDLGSSAALPVCHLLYLQGFA